VKVGSVCLCAGEQYAAVFCQLCWAQVVCWLSGVLGLIKGRWLSLGCVCVCGDILVEHTVKLSLFLFPQEDKYVCFLSSLSTNEQADTRTLTHVHSWSLGNTLPYFYCFNFCFSALLLFFSLWYNPHVCFRGYAGLMSYWYDCISHAWPTSSTNFSKIIYLLPVFSLLLPPSPP